MFPWPYTNLHEINIDWILDVVKTFQAQYTQIDQKIADALEELTNMSTVAVEEFQQTIQQLTAEEQAAVIAAIDAHVAEVIETIPADYSALSAKVTALEALRDKSYIEENNNASTRFAGYEPHYFVLENGNISDGADSDASKPKRLRTIGYLSTASIQYVVNEAIHPSKLYIHYYDSDFTFQALVDTGKIGEAARFNIDRSYAYFRITYICYDALDSNTQINISPEDGYKAIYFFANQQPILGSLPANNIVAAKYAEKPILAYPVLEQGNIQGGADSTSSNAKRVRTRGFYSTGDIKRIIVNPNAYIRVYVIYYSSQSVADYVGQDYQDQLVNISSSQPYCRLVFIKYDDAAHTNQEDIIPRDIEENVVFTGGADNAPNNEVILNSLEGLREQMGEANRRLNVVEQACSIDTVPSFYEDYITAKIAAINALAPATGEQFIFATDYHGLSYGSPSKYNNNNHMKSLINRIVNNTSISLSINGGDVANSYQGRRSRAEFLRGIRRICQYHMPDQYATTLFIAGNHDLGSDGSGGTITEPVISEEDLYINSGLASIASKVTIDPVTPWNYYYDSPEAKIRYIILLTSNLEAWGFTNGSACYDFLADALHSLESGWTAVVAYHWAFGTNDQVTTQTTQIATIMSKYNARASYGLYDFSNGAGVAPIIISGHQHKDLDTTLTPVSGYPIIVVMTTTDCWDGEVESSENTRTENTTSEDAFDVFTIDTTNQVITATRIGGGAESRSWTY